MLLLSKLHATQAFLDDILLKPASLLRNMNIAEWTHLITATITLARLSRLEPEKTREAGIEHLQIKIQVDTYIVTLCERMSDLGVSNVQYDTSGLFSWFKAIAQGIRLWVSGPGESGGHDHVDAESLATSETLQDLTLQNGSNRQLSSTNQAHAADQGHEGNTQDSWSEGYGMALDDNFWDTFISNWPDITVPSVAWKRYG
jgi:hypothetical protein